MNTARTRIAFGFILICAATLYIFLNRQYRLGAFNDDSFYVITATDLWNQSVRNILPQIKPDFPLPGLPLIFFPAAKLFGPHWLMLEWLSVFATLLNGFLLGLLARKWLSDGETLLVVSLYVFNPTVARYSGILMPAPFYTTFVLGCLLLMRNLIESPTPLKAVALGFLLGWGSLIRLEGILLFISIMSVLVIFYRKKVFLGAMAIPLICWGLFVVAWFQFRQLPRMEYASELSALVIYWRHHFFEGIMFGHEMVQVFLGTVTAHSFPPHPFLTLMEVATFIFLVLFISVGAHHLWRQHSVKHSELISAGIFCCLYVPTYYFWHLIVPRYYVPLLPFVFIFFVRGIMRVSVFIGKRTLWGGAVIAYLFVCYIPANGLAVHESLWAPDPMKRPPWRTLQWVKDNTAPNTKIFSPMAPSIALYTGRYSTSDFSAKNAEEFKFFLLNRDLDYILDRKVIALTPGVGSTEKPNQAWAKVRRWMKSRPREFEPVFHDSVEETAIYRVTGKPEFINAYVMYLRAARLYQARRFPEAFHFASEAVALYPDLASAKNLLGVLCVINGRFDKAEHLFLETLELRPDSLLVRFNLATFYRIKGQPERSLDYIRQGLLVSRAKGEEDRFQNNFKNFQDAWNNNGAGFFVDSMAVQ